MTLTVLTLKHVPLEDVLEPLSEELHDLVIECLQNSEISWGTNADTFMTAPRLVLVLEGAMEHYLDNDDAANAAAETKTYKSVVAALNQLPQDVFISLGG